MEYFNTPSPTQSRIPRATPSPYPTSPSPASSSYNRLPLDLGSPLSLRGPLARQHSPSQGSPTLSPQVPRLVLTPRKVTPANPGARRRPAPSVADIKDFPYVDSSTTTRKITTPRQSSSDKSRVTPATAPAQSNSRQSSSSRTANRSTNPVPRTVAAPSSRPPQPPVKPKTLPSSHHYLKRISENTDLSVPKALGSPGYQLQVTKPDGEVVSEDELGIGLGIAGIRIGKSSKVTVGTNPLDEETNNISGRTNQPHHISIRLRLLSKLAAVLERQPTDISSLVDVESLLEKVDESHKRADQKSLASRSSTETTSSLELRPPVQTAMALPTAINNGSRRQSGKMMDILRKIKRKDDGESMRAKSQLMEGLTFDQGVAFGVRLDAIPDGAWCTSLIGGQPHQLPIVIFNVVEEIFQRGMAQPGIFRLAGDPDRINQLYHIHNSPPWFGDDLDISLEPLHNLTGIVKRFIRDLPEPILDESLFNAFLILCSETPSLEGGGTTETKSDSRQILAAQILLRLLPPHHFSLFIYLLAFLGQLPLYPENKLNIESICIIFGPAMCASRSADIPGLGPSSSLASPGRGTATLTGTPIQVERDSAVLMVEKSQQVLSWLMTNWAEISENLLGSDGSEDTSLYGEQQVEGVEAGRVTPDHLMAEGPPAEIPSTPGLRLPSRSSQRSSCHPAPTSQPLSSTNPSTISSASAYSTTTTAVTVSTAPTSASEQEGNPAAVPMERSRSKSENDTAVSRRMSRSISGRKLVSWGKDRQKRDRRASSSSIGSIGSIKSFFKRSGKEEDEGFDAEGRMKLSKRKLPPRSSEYIPLPTSWPIAGGTHEPEPQASAVLGSLHDLLVSKDGQIKRDKKEIEELKKKIEELERQLRESQQNPDPSVSDNRNSTYSTKDNPVSTSTSINNNTPGFIQGHLRRQSSTSTQQLSNLQSQVARLLTSLESSRIEHQRKDDSILQLEGAARAWEKERRGWEIQVKEEIEKRIEVEGERDAIKKKLDEVRGALND